MQNLNTNFSFTVDFSDVELRKQRLDLVEGYYTVKITEAYINADRNANRVIFKLAFQGDFEGNSKLTGLNLPGTTQKDVRGLWMNLMLSAGYTLEQLKSGSIEITPAALVNRDACLYFRPKDEEATDGDLMYDKFNFLTPSNFASSKANFEARKQSTGSKPVATAQPAAGFASPNVSSADLLNMVKG